MVRLTKVFMGKFINFINKTTFQVYSENKLLRIFFLDIRAIYSHQKKKEAETFYFIEKKF